MWCQRCNRDTWHETDECPGPLRAAGRNARARGTNQRKNGTNPRARATNPSAGTSADIARVARLVRRAVARYRVATGDPWCATCDDTGTVLVDAVGQGSYRPCPTHRTMTANDAQRIIDGGR